MGKPSRGRLERITRCLAYCAPDGAAVIQLAEVQTRQELAAQQFERELAALYREFGWASPGRHAES